MARVLTGFVPDAAAVDRVFARLRAEGLPRDLIAVAVGPESAERHYPRRTRRPGTRAIAWTGAGGLLGLFMGAFIALVAVLVPGAGLLEGPRAMVALLGPNVGLISGAVLGGLFGRFVRRDAPPYMHRAARDPRILIAVRPRTAAEEARLSVVLEREGVADLERG